MSVLIIWISEVVTQYFPLAYQTIFCEWILSVARDKALRKTRIAHILKCLFLAKRTTCLDMDSLKGNQQNWSMLSVSFLSFLHFTLSIIIHGLFLIFTWSIIIDIFFSFKLKLFIIYFSLFKCFHFIHHYFQLVITNRNNFLNLMNICTWSLSHRWYCGTASWCPILWHLRLSKPEDSNQEN